MIYFQNYQKEKKGNGKVNNVFPWQYIFKISDILL